jgi:molecular chaperone DnaK (HSP70)
VISCPGYWSERQRRALLDAAEIAGLNVLRLLNEHTATALAYGIYKTDLPETEPRKVLFVDMGNTATTASVASFVKGKLQVLSYTQDENLGGRDFDEAIAQHLAVDIQKKLGADPRKNMRQWLRVLAACEKQVKRVISAGTPRANVSIDNLANERDYQTAITREQFVELCTPLLDRLAAPITRALEMAGVKPAELASVEIMGGGMRLPFVQDRVQQLLGRELSKTLNMEEAIARGCALMCAMLSPVFRVREFKVEDITPYPIKLFWRTIGEGTMDDTDSAVIIPKNSPLPAPKMVSFARTQPIQFTARYEEPETVPAAGKDGFIGTYSVLSLPAPANPKETPKLKVKAKLSINGTFAVEEAEMLEVIEETVEIEEPATPPPQPQAPSTTTAAATSPPPPPADPATVPPTTATPEQPSQATSPSPPPPASASPQPQQPTPEAAATPMATDEKPASPAPVTPAGQPEAKRKRTEVRKKVVRKDVSVKQETLGLAKGTLQKMFEEEAKMQAADKLAKETADMKNAVESYQYTIRDKLSGELAKYGTPEDVAKLKRELDDARDWLYGDGEAQTKGIYAERLKKMQALGDPICRRKAEADARPAAIRELESATAQWAAFVATKDEKYSHIE